MTEEARQPLADDDDLAKRSRRDDYVIQRVVKFSILGACLLAGTVILSVALYAIVFNQQWREYAIKSVFANLPGIAAVAITVLGIKKLQ